MRLEKAGLLHNALVELKTSQETYEGPKLENREPPPASKYLPVIVTDVLPDKEPTIGATLINSGIWYVKVHPSSSYVWWSPYVLR